jgi:hypothetical protein
MVVFIIIIIIAIFLILVITPNLEDQVSIFRLTNDRLTQSHSQAQGSLYVAFHDSMGFSPTHGDAILPYFMVQVEASERASLFHFGTHMHIQFLLSDRATNVSAKPPIWRTWVLPFN